MTNTLSRKCRVGWEPKKDFRIREAKDFRDTDNFESVSVTRLMLRCEECRLSQFSSTVEFLLLSLPSLLERDTLCLSGGHPFSSSPAPSLVNALRILSAIWRYIDFFLRSFDDEGESNEFSLFILSLSLVYYMYVVCVSISEEFGDGVSDYFSHWKV